MISIKLEYFNCIIIVKLHKKNPMGYQVFLVLAASRAPADQMYGY